MKKMVAVAMALALVGFVSPALCADDPTGTWKWSTTFGDNTIESTLKVKLEGDKLTGVYVGRNNTESPISDGTFKDNMVKFNVVREFNGNKFTIKYSGTLSGDSIKGKSEFERDGQAQSRDFEAKRQK
jgi:hypothetical protein